MKNRNPSALFMLYRRVRLKLSAGRVWPFLGYFSALLFCGCAYVHRLMYRLRILLEQGVEGCVVSIGNIVIGGSGKTQVILWLMGLLEEDKDRVAILSRGYKGKLSSKRCSIRVNLKEHSAKDVGDEPCLIASQSRDIPVIIGKNRLFSARMAADLGRSILCLDDGLQFRKLRKDVNIIVVNGSDPIGGGRFFPQGRLRDFPSRLQEADFIIINGDYNPLVERVLEVHSDAPKIFVRPVLKEIYFRSGLPGCDLKNCLLHNTLVGVFCALGNPKSFVATVERAGGVIVNEYFLSDHSAISLKELQMLSAQTKIRFGKMLLCSEKDVVKIPDEWLLEEGVLPLGVLRSELELVYNQDAVLDLISFIKEKSRGTLL